MSPKPPPNYTWTKTQQGHYERATDSIEQFYTHLSAQYQNSAQKPFFITGHLTLQIPIPTSHTPEAPTQRLESALRTAWLHLLYLHPTLGAQTTYDTQQHRSLKVYRPFEDETQKEIWLSTTFIPLSPGITGEEWSNKDPPTPTLPTLFLITPPEAIDRETQTLRRDIIFRAPHDIIDGMGTLQLLNNLIQRASDTYSGADVSTEPQFSEGDEVGNLSPAFCNAADVSVPTAAQKARFEREIGFNAASREDCEVLCLPFRQGALVPGTHRRVVRMLSQVQTTELVCACRGVGASITHVFHAAIALCLRDMQPKGADARSVRYIGYCLINERGRCRPPFNTAAHAVAVYHSVSGKNLVIDLVVPGTRDTEAETKSRKKEEFSNVVRTVTAFYRENQEDTERLPLVPLHLALRTPPYPTNADPGDTLPIPPPNMLPSVSMSSFGVIENSITPMHSPFTLYNPWVTGEELGTGLGVFAGTFRGQLSLSAAYNTAWHDEPEVLAYLQRCIDLVAEGLNLQSFRN